MSIKWNRSEDGYVDSKCGRFQIRPLFCGRTRPIWFLATDTTTTNKKSSYCNTQKEAKEWSETLWLKEQPKETDGVNLKVENRCGECKNCKELEQVRKQVLACCNPPFNHADDGVINFWNEELKRLHCLKLAETSGGKNVR